MARKLEEAVSELPHLEHYYTRVGRVSGFMGGSNVGVNLAEIGVTVADRGERDLTLDDFLDRLRPAAARIPSAQVSLQRAGGGAGAAPVEVEIQGDDLDAIRRIALDVKDVVERAPGTTSVRKSWQSGQPELRVLPDQERIARHYLSVAKVAREVRAYVDGREVREFRDVDEDYDIRIRLQKADRERAEQVEGFFIKSPATGEMLQIGQVADLSYEPAPTLITRRDRTRYVSIQSQLTGERSQTETVEAIRQGIDEDVEVPDDVEIAYAGETELIQKNFKELYQALAIAAGLTFLAASGIIESFIFGFVIIVSVPLSLIGVIIAMLIGGVTINVFSLMAIIMLVGMVVNNAIIIIDYAERPEFADKSPAERVKNSCSARFRVILMANLTTIAAMVPLALGLGFAGEIFRPIAVVQIGGVFAAGVVSLLLIPAVYCMVMDRKERKTAARSA
jgi:HAE1 family hydrophobic/amphiphilic exporter-1